jgi:hypothetical protein
MADRPIIDTRVSIALHPSSIDAIPEASDEDVQALLQPARDALAAGYQFIASIHDVKAAAAIDPELTKEAALLRTDDHARAKMERATRAFDSVHKQFTTSINALEIGLSSAVEAKASAMVSGEIRSHFKGLDSKERIAQLEAALERRDETTLSSVLGAPGYLSGLAPELQTVMLRRFNEVRDPVAAKRLRVLIATRDAMMERGQTLLREMVKAVGDLEVPMPGPDGKSFGTRKVSVNEVRRKRDAARAAYKSAAA